VIDNTAVTIIAGTFANLSGGSTFTTHGNKPSKRTTKAVMGMISR